MAKEAAAAKEAADVKAVSYTVTMKQDKVTKNAVRFEEVAEVGQPNKIGTLYVQKFPFGETLPQQITVTVTVVE